MILCLDHASRLQIFIFFVECSLAMYVCMSVIAFYVFLYALFIQFTCLLAQNPLPQQLLPPKKKNATNLYVNMFSHHIWAHWLGANTNYGIAELINKLIIVYEIISVTICYIIHFLFWYKRKSHAFLPSKNPYCWNIMNYWWFYIFVRSHWSKETDREKNTCFQSIMKNPLLL